MIIGTKDDNRHLEELEKVFKIQQEANLKLNARKTKLFTDETDYLGFKVSKKGI